jgi:bifunctional DNA-binding transcriptional regulator/antitoxin component of YhaV-PrlF toxin-antitoxin module
MDFAIAKMSTKGQIVIPRLLREDLSSGEEFLVVKDKGTFVIKRVSDLAKNLKNDFKFANSIDKAWKEYEKGQFKSMTKGDFLEELDKW